jgi:CheY-like chemotaxis protein
MVPVMRPYRVLVVDDHLDTAEVLAVLFRMLGHETRTALRGRDALVLARENDFDVILLDIGLPDMDGYDVVRALRADPRRPGHPERYIAAVTGHCRPVDVTRAVTAGFNDHVTKPIDLIKIRQILRCADSHYAPSTPAEASGSRSSPPTPAPAA